MTSTSPSLGAALWLKLSNVSMVVSMKCCLSWPAALGQCEAKSRVSCLKPQHCCAWQGCIKQGRWAPTLEAGQVLGERYGGRARKAAIAPVVCAFDTVLRQVLGVSGDNCTTSDACRDTSVTQCMAGYLASTVPGMACKRQHLPGMTFATFLLLTIP